MKDGTVEMDVIALSNIKNIVKGIILNAFPVGTIISNITGTNPSEYLGGTWEEVSQGRVLQGADDTHKAGATIEAGLPNIKASTTGFEYTLAHTKRGDGVFTVGDTADASISADNNNPGYYWRQTWVNFDLSKGNAIYGASDTVQPPAYVVHFWKRTA